MKFDAAWLERRPPLTSQSIPKTLLKNDVTPTERRSLGIFFPHSCHPTIRTVEAFDAAKVLLTTQLDHSAEFRLVHLSDS